MKLFREYGYILISMKASNEFFMNIHMFCSFAPKYICRHFGESNMLKKQFGNLVDEETVKFLGHLIPVSYLWHSVIKKRQKKGV
jgi:hypothetical protein